MSEFEALWNGGPVFAQADHFKLSTDSVLLANFVHIIGKKQIIDLGCASGAIPVLLLAAHERVCVTGLELLSEAAELAKQNMIINGFEARSGIVCGDIREHRSLFRSGSFDIVTSNPPYYPVGSGKTAAEDGRAGARSELTCSLDDICRAAAFLLKTGGSLYMVHKPERLSEIFCCMSAHKLEPKRLRLVCTKPGAAPSLVLIEGKRGGKPGLKIESNLLLCNEDGSESSEYKTIYHR